MGGAGHLAASRAQRRGVDASEVARALAGSVVKVGQQQAGVSQVDSHRRSLRPARASLDFWPDEEVAPLLERTDAIHPEWAARVRAGRENLAQIDRRAGCRWPETEDYGIRWSLRMLHAEAES